MLIYGVTLCQTTNIYDRMEHNPLALKSLENFFTNICTVIYLIQSGDIQHSKTNFLSTCLESSTFVVVDVSGHLLEAVGHFNGWVTCKEFSGCTLSASRPSDYKHVKLGYPLHKV